MPDRDPAAGCSGGPTTTASPEPPRIPDCGPLKRVTIHTDGGCQGNPGPGAWAAVRDDGVLIGSVSGGCIEGAVAEAAMKTIDSGAPQLLDFGVTHERAWEVGLACGGKVKVFVEKMN